MDGLVHLGLNSCYLPFQDSMKLRTGVKVIKSTWGYCNLINHNNNNSYE